MNEVINPTEVASNVITNLIEDSIKSAWSRVGQFFKDLDAKDSIIYQTAYEKYLTNTYKCYSQIKTIIYRRVPRYLYSFYECVGLNYNFEEIDTENICNLIECLGRKIIISGTGGTGKSILFKHLFLNSIKETNYIPVLIELRSFNSKDRRAFSLYDEIYNTLINNGFLLNKEYYEYSLNNGAYIVFLDGYDEVNRDKSEILTSEIKTLSSKYNRNIFLLSTRPSQEFIGWNDFKEAVMLPLKKCQALDLVNKIDFDETVKRCFCEELDERLYDKYESFASNPLLLNIMLLTFEKHATIPDCLNDFYEEAFNTLFNAHDATKDAYVRDIRSGLGYSDFKLVFSYICFKSYFAAEYEFSEARLRELIDLAKVKFNWLSFVTKEYLEDLTLSVCMLVKDGLKYRFAHRSFQEYFAAYYTCRLDDDLQGRLLRAWIKERRVLSTDGFLRMLFNLQGEKFNKVVLNPALKTLRDEYNSLGLSVELIKLFFKSVSFDFSNQKSNSGIRWVLNDEDYLFSILVITGELNNYKFSGKDKKERESVYNKIKNAYEKKYKIIPNNVNLSFEKVLELITEEDLFCLFSSIKDELLFAFEILDKCESGSVNRKKRVSAILQDLQIPH